MVIYLDFCARVSHMSLLREGFAAVGAAAWVLSRFSFGKHLVPKQRCKRNTVRSSTVKEEHDHTMTYEESITSLQSLSHVCAQHATGCMSLCVILTSLPATFTLKSSCAPSRLSKSVWFSHSCATHLKKQVQFRRCSVPSGRYTAGLLICTSVRLKFNT